MYTPKTINDIVFKSASEKEKITDIIQNNKPFPVSGVNGIILYGIYGTGKTALSKLLPDVIEKAKGGNSADARFVSCISGSNGLALIQDLSVQAGLVSLSTVSRYHYFILDEVDLLTVNAMTQLKSLMNIPSTIFIMTTNHVASVEKGVQNRSILVDFNAAPADQWLPVVHKVLANMNVTGVSDDALLKVIQTCNGSARQIVNAVTTIAVRRNRQSLRVVN